MIKGTKNIPVSYHLVVFLSFFLIMLYQTILRAETYWIIENPSALVIYNQYEQRMAESEKTALQKFSVWKILSENQFLSDQFTAITKVSLTNKIFYFQRSVNGELINYEDAGRIEILKNPKIIGDTIRIKQTNQIFLVNAEEPIGLSEGTLLKRHFKYQNRYYVEKVGNKQTGWITLPPTNFWEKYRPGSIESPPDEKILIQIENIFKTYNQRLGKLFEYLNTKYETRHPLPQWSGERFASSIRYKIKPNSYRNRFNDTQFQIIQELRDQLHGSSFQVKEDQNQIIISRESN